MHASTVILISFATSLVTAVATVYVVEQYDIVKAKEQTASTTVPDLRKLSEDDARASANAAHLSLVVGSREPNAEAKPGTVVSQSIPAGQSVQQGFPLSVVLSQELPKVPSVVELTVEGAAARLGELGYTLQVGGRVPTNEVPPGQIVSQMPKADTPYVKGAAVTVQVSSGPDEVEMPKLLGVPYNKATEQLEELGLKPVVGWTDLGETPTYVILNQNPGPGTKLKPGSEVRLTVNR